MASAERSLRKMVEYWLAPNAVKPVRVTTFRNRRLQGECFVRVEAWKTEEPIAMFFFRHRDGSWRIFPPNPQRPAMAHQWH